MKIESDNKVLHQEKIKLCGYDVRYEIWSWKGCWAEIFIFDNEDIEGLTDQRIETLVKKFHLIKGESDIAFYRLYHFTFVIINFQVGTNIEIEPKKRYK